MTTPSPSIPSNSPWKVLVPVLLILGLVALSLMVIKSQLSHSPHSSQGSVQIREGAILPDFELTSLDGNKTLISKVPGKVLLINFWASWCSACLEEMPSIVALRTAYKDRGFEVLGINLDETPETVAPRLVKKLKMEFPIFKDTDGALGDLFDIHAIPLTVIIDQQRKILYSRDGELDWDSDEVHAQIEKWLQK